RRRILKHDLIRRGSPDVYQLRTENKKIGCGVTKMTVGKRNPNKSNRTILLVGETGTGKSTLINALVNYTMGVQWEDELWFQIVKEEKRSQSESQTSDVIVYEIFEFENKTLPYSLTIIDTPGFGDTRGSERDAVVANRLLQLFESEDGVHEVHAVGLVMKASENRMSDRLRQTFDSVMSLFGKNVERNIVALITHSNGAKPKNACEALEAANIKCARNEKNEPAHFLFNNSQHEDRKEEEKYSKYAHEVSEKGMREFTTFLGKAVPQKLQKTVEVLIKKQRLAACIKNLQDRIKRTEGKQREITEIEQALKIYEENMKANENFKVKYDEEYTVKVNINGGSWGVIFYNAAVSCTFCQETCHHPCENAWNAEWCRVMSSGRCTVCTNNCPAANHVKANWIYENRRRTVEKTFENIKEKYEKNKSQSEKNLSILENLEEEKNRLTAEKSQFLDKSYQHVVRLEQIALKADSASTVVHLDFLIEKMKERGDTEKVQKLEEIRGREDKRTSTM
uniref:AIG1-type G domain-containing protein n=1 Tax=Neolamprologus brichardi TaxID=32507 RepID=A0A3Q4HKG1_NEOBR